MAELGLNFKCNLLHIHTNVHMQSIAATQITDMQVGEMHFNTHQIYGLIAMACVVIVYIVMATGHRQSPVG